MRMHGVSESPGAEHARERQERVLPQDLDRASADSFALANDARAEHGSVAVELPNPSNSKERTRLQLYVAILLLDLASIASAFLLANFARFADFLADPGVSYIPLAAALYAVLAFGGKAYSVEVLQRPGTGIKRALRSLTLAAAAVLVVFFTLKTSGQSSRAVLLGGFALSACLVGLARYLFGKAAGKKHGWNFIREVIILDDLAVLPRRGQVVLVAERSGLSPFSNDRRRTTGWAGSLQTATASSLPALPRSGLRGEKLSRVRAYLSRCSPRNWIISGRFRSGRPAAAPACSLPPAR